MYILLVIWIIVIYIIGIFLHIFGPPSWGRKKLWHKITGIALLICIINAMFPLFIELLPGHGRSIQSEAKVNLAGIATMENTYFEKYGVFTERFDQLGWMPIGRTKYSYYLSEKPSTNTFIERLNGDFTRKFYSVSGSKFLETVFYLRFPGSKSDTIIEREIHRKIALKYGIGVTATSFTAVAIANIDSDDAFDVWIVGQSKRPINPYNDREEFDFETPDTKSWLMKFNSNGIYLNLDRSALLLLFINALLWIAFTSTANRRKDISDSD